MVIATAGHVDHGKSTLIRALTGMEPDRWAEERRRGMTIDLGYAWTRLADGSTVAFVDVPGHRRFITNTLAGIGPVPAVLLVIAADEGWSRQTTEHVAALDALNVRHGILAITRADLGDPELAAEEAADYLSGTSLEGIEAVAVDSISGSGLPALREQLLALAAKVGAPAVTTQSRLWVDRVFTIRGAGTIVTGTLGTGRIRVGEELELAPAGTPVRVRQLESTKLKVNDVNAVARVAVNLRGLKPDRVHRGDALVAPGQWVLATVMDVRLVRINGQVPLRPILHIGSAAVGVRVRMLGNDTARLALDRPLPLHVGDRALLRDPGMQRVVAGVVVLDMMPPELRRRGSGAARSVELSAMGDAPDLVAELARRGAARREFLISAGILHIGIEPPVGTVEASGWLIHPQQWASWASALDEAVATWAAANPMSPAMPVPDAVRAVGLPEPRLLTLLASQNTLLHIDADRIGAADVRPVFETAVGEALDDLRARLELNPFDAPEAPELSAAGLTDRHLSAAVSAGLLVHVGDGIFLRPEAPTLAVKRLIALEQPFTLSQARQTLQTTRRVAMPLLETLDRRGLTRRVDTDRRIVRSSSSRPGSR